MWADSVLKCVVFIFEGSHDKTAALCLKRILKSDSVGKQRRSCSTTIKSCLSSPNSQRRAVYIDLSVPGECIKQPESIPISGRWMLGWLINAGVFGINRFIRQRAVLVMAGQLSLYGLLSRQTIYDALSYVLNALCFLCDVIDVLPAPATSRIVVYDDKTTNKPTNCLQTTWLDGFLQYCCCNTFPFVVVFVSRLNCRSQITKNRKQ